MEENNGIKIKAYMIYSIVMLPMIGIFAYLEVLVIKKIIASIKLENRAEVWGSILVILLIHLIYLVAVLYLIDFGRKIELTKEGCMISFLWIKRRYSWEEYPIKKVERYSIYRSLWAPNTPYDEGAVFSKVPVKHSKKYQPGETRSFLTRYVFSTVWICFRNEECGKKWSYNDGLYEVDKKEFLQKMEEWGVELEKPE